MLRRRKPTSRVEDMVPCPSCQRHARVDESSCPFCGAALITIEAVVAQESTAPARGLHSLAFGVGLKAMTVMAAGALTIAGCTGLEKNESEAGGSDYGGPDEVSDTLDTFDTNTTSDTETTTDTTETTTDTTTDTTDTTDATTGPVNMCGWDAMSGWYDCGFEGEDPEGTNPIGCPDGLVDGDPCENTGLTDVGCCDANGDNWYCAMGNVVFYNACG